MTSVAASGGPSWAALAALAVSSLALLFGVASFWWMNWRRGRLVVAAPRSYAGAAVGDHLIIRLPLVLYNTGAAPIVVQNLKLSFVDSAEPPMSFVATGVAVDPADDPDHRHTLASGFPVVGRSAVLVVAVFKRARGAFHFEARDYRLRLDGHLLHRPNSWRELLEFTLRVSEKSAPILNKRYIAHDNMPFDGS